VPADVRLAEAVNLRIEEASLTGEVSAGQEELCQCAGAKRAAGDRKNTAFMGHWSPTAGAAGLVTSTGMNTQLGLIATMLQNVEERR